MTAAVAAAIDRGRGGGHAWGGERVRRGDIAVRDVGGLAALVDVQLTRLLVVGVRVTLVSRPVVARAGMHGLMGDVALRGVLLLVLLLLLNIVVIVMPSLHRDGCVAVGSHALAGAVVVARVSVVPRRHVAFRTLLVLGGVPLATVSVAALHGPVIGRVIRGPGLGVPVVLGAGVPVLVLLVELHASVVHPRRARGAPMMADSGPHRLALPRVKRMHFARVRDRSSLLCI